MKNISNNADILDSRDIISRIEELEAIFSDAEISEENGATPQLDENGDIKVDESTCGECGKSWNDALISGSTPAPSGRCPYEHIHEEIEELSNLLALQEEASGSSDWTYGETLIRDSYFQEYAQELAEDIGAINKQATWPNNCIDWERAADELKQDYFSVDFDGVDYWIRS